jgi:hypothetical protein
MLAAHLGEGLVGALNDALAADIDPAARGHLAVHHQALAIEFVEMLPVGPVRHEVGIGEQHAGRIGMGAEDADGLARLDQQGLVALQPAQAGDDRVIALPIARGAADTAIDDQLLGLFGDFGIEIVHQHAQRGFGEPALRAQLGAAGGADVAAVVAAIGHVVFQSRQAVRICRRCVASGAARVVSYGVGQLVSSGVRGSLI